MQAVVQAEHITLRGACGMGVAPGPHSSGLWEALGAVGLTHGAVDSLILIFLIFTNSVTACFYVCFFSFSKETVEFLYLGQLSFFTVNSQFKLMCGGCVIPIILYHSCLPPQPPEESLTTDRASQVPLET